MSISYIQPLYTPPESTLIRVDKSPTYLKIYRPFNAYQFSTLLGEPLLKAFFIFIPIAFVSLYILFLPLHWPIGALAFGYLCYKKRQDFVTDPYSFSLTFQGDEITFKKRMFGWLIREFRSLEKKDLDQIQFQTNTLEIQTETDQVFQLAFECTTEESRWLNTELMVFLDQMSPMETSFESV